MPNYDEILFERITSQLLPSSHTQLNVAADGGSQELYMLSKLKYLITKSYLLELSITSKHVSHLRARVSSLGAFIAKL